MSGFTEISDRVDLSGVNLDDSLICSGMYWVRQRTGEAGHIECPEPAAWARTTRCCKVVTTMKCEEHYQDIRSRSSWVCETCLKRNYETGWRRL